MITVVVPAYQASETIGRTLDSLVAQTRNDFNVIVVDDGSEDDTLSIVETYRPSLPALRIVSHASNKGLGPARNTGIKETKTDYITFLDSDDELHPDCIETLYAGLDGHDVLVFGWQRVDESNGGKVTAKRVDGDHFQLDRVKFLKKLFSANVQFMSCAAAFSSPFLKKHSIYYQNMRHEDLPFMAKVYLSSRKTDFLKDYYGYIWHVRRGSITTSQNSKNLLGLLRSYHFIKAELLAESPELNVAWNSGILRYFNTFFNQWDGMADQALVAALVEEIKMDLCSVITLERLRALGLSDSPMARQLIKTELGIADHRYNKLNDRFRSLIQRVFG